MGSAVRIRHCPATVSAENLSNIPLGGLPFAPDFGVNGRDASREGASGSLRRKSGDRPDARQLGVSGCEGRAGELSSDSGSDVLLQKFLLAAYFLRSGIFLHL